MLRFTFNSTDVQVIQAFDIKGEKLVNALVGRMTQLMIKLQERSRANLEATRSNKVQIPSSGALRESITNPRATAEGGTIIGTLDWGGGVPYARIQEYGGVKPYVINPLGEEGTKGSFVKGAYGQTLWRRGHLKGAIRRFGQNVLQFIGAQDNKVVYAPSVFKKQPLRARHFMSDALEGMRQEIIQGLRETILGVMREMRY